MLKSQKLYDGLKSKIAYGNDISQTAQFAFTGNAEIGFIALSLALAPDMVNKGSYYIVSQSLYKPIEQACILIKTPVLNTEAAKFRKFVLSPATKGIWEKWGYVAPNP